MGNQSSLNQRKYEKLYNLVDVDEKENVDKNGIIKANVAREVINYMSANHNIFGLNQPSEESQAVKLIRKIDFWEGIFD